MRVSHLSTSADGGGAARAMMRLHLGLLATACDSSVFFLEGSDRWPSGRRLAISNSFVARLRRKYFRFAGRGRVRPPSLAHDSFSDDRSVFNAEVSRQLPATDVVHLHWVTKFFDAPQLLPKLQSPAVWTLHDMNPFTGGCHYSEGCERFATRCGRCPQLGSTRERDAAAACHGRKNTIQRNVSPDRLVIVAPSTWMAENARRSTVFQSYTTETIPYGIDLDRFQPMERTAARKQLGIEANVPLLLFCADYQTPRKGFSQFISALEHLRTLPRLAVLSVGDGAPTTELPVPHHRLGRINDDAQMARAYSAADVFLIPSLEDNQPNTILEALACGTPVIGFATGGIQEAIGEAGITVPLHDVAALALAVQTLLTDDARRINLGRAARARAERHYPASLQASRYISLYERLKAQSARRTITSECNSNAASFLFPSAPG